MAKSTSEAHIRANRRHSLKSTRPHRSQQPRIRKNAVKHGLIGLVVVMAEEGRVLWKDRIEPWDFNDPVNSENDAGFASRERWSFGGLMVASGVVSVQRVFLLNFTENDHWFLTPFNRIGETNPTAKMAFQMLGCVDKKVGKLRCQANVTEP